MNRQSPKGNERLTASVGLVLLVLLAVEALTTLELGALLPLHVFLGLLLLTPLVLKLASTGWRFLRYYTGAAAYRLKGPPSLPLRLLAPLLVVSTVSLFGSGLGLIVVGHGGGWLLRLHAASFVVWGVLVVLHAAAYLSRTLRVGTADWRAQTSSVVPGRRGRRGLLVGALVLGVILALAIYPAQRYRRHHDSNGQRAVTPATRNGGTAAGPPRRWIQAVMPAGSRVATLP